MTESQIERRLRARVMSAGGQCLKWVSPGHSGVPDRICLFPNGRVVFVELKRPGKKAEPLQAHVHGQLRLLGFDVRVIDSYEAADAI